MTSTFTDSQFNNQLFTFCQNALINFYCTIEELPAFASESKRNEILIQYLKPKLRDNQFKLLKRELKRLKTLLENKKSNGEQCVIELMEGLEKSKSMSALNANEGI